MRFIRKRARERKRERGGLSENVREEGHFRGRERERDRLWEKE